MSDLTYPTELEITPLAKPPSATVAVPGSKSITNRALVLAAMTAWHGPCRLSGALRSEDTEIMVRALAQLGFAVETHWDNSPPAVIVGPHFQGEGEYPPFPADLFVANSGTTMRFLAALVTLGKGQFRIDGVSRMRSGPSTISWMPCAKWVRARSEVRYRPPYSSRAITSGRVITSRCEVKRAVNSSRPC